MRTVRTSAGGESSVSQSVIEAIAEAKGTDPVELTPPLFEVIDPDALDQLFAATPTNERMGGQVVFTHNGHEITVHGDNSVSVKERNE